jgi:RHS repeat-associated protein
LDIAAYKTFVSTSATTEANGQYTDKVTDALGNVTDTNWDATKGLLTSSIDAKNVTTSYTYHTNNDKLTSVSSGNATVSYGYTGDQLSTITRNNFSYGFTFDSLGNPTSVKMETIPLITHSYQPRTSLLLSSEYANGGKVSYNYDTLDRVIGVTIGNAASPQFEYRYDASGNLAIVKDNVRSITTYLEYDLANRLSKITDSQGHAITVGFDAKNRLSGVTEVLKGTTYTSSYTYNADNQPATVSADGKTHSYTYDLLGRLSGTSLNTTTPYTTALTYKTNPSTGSSSHVLASYRSGSTTTTYQVDANGNITQLSDGTYTYTYVYDDFNQLKRENNPLLNKSITYQYDLGGNLLAVNEYAYTTGTLGSLITSVPFTYVSAWKDQLTKIGDDGLTYDTNGNLLSYKTRSYSWQAGRQLVQITDTDEDNIFTADYTYNESGIRTRKEVNEVITDYVLEGGKVILETTGSDTLHYSYDSRGQLVSFKLNGTPYFYTRNGQGDITGLIDASGTQVVKYTYDSWGKPISITGSLALTVGAKNPYRYRGYRYDHESGLYYLQSRYYDPSIKRFISADDGIDLGADLLGYNMFQYCANNPVNYADPTGEFIISILIIGVAAGAVIGGVGGGYASKKIYGKIQWEWVAGGTVIGGLLGYFAAPAVVSATGVAGISITSAGISTVAATGTSFGALGTLISNNGRQIIDWGKTTLHGIQRMAERGVTQSMANAWVKSGKALQQSGGQILYVTKQGAVCVNKAGQVITAYTSKYFDATMKLVVEKLFGK